MRSHSRTQPQVSSFAAMVIVTAGITHYPLPKNSVFHHKYGRASLTGTVRVIRRAVSQFQQADSSEIPLFFSW